MFERFNAVCLSSAVPVPVSDVLATLRLLHSEEQETRAEAAHHIPSEAGVPPAFTISVWAACGSTDDTAYLTDG